MSLLSAAAALVSYAAHKKSCRKAKTWHAECTCGRDEVLRALDKEFTKAKRKEIRDGKKR